MKINKNLEIHRFDFLIFQVHQCRSKSKLIYSTKNQQDTFIVEK